MGWQAVVTLAVVLAMLGLLARDLVPAPVAVLGAAIGLLLLGVLTPEQAFAGFANPAPWTVAALYVLARAVGVSGLLDTVVARVLGSGERAATVHDRAADRRQLTRLTPLVGVASGLLNNTPVVAMLAPRVTRWAAQRRCPPSQLLMPMSFAAILGGLLTAIGTSTTLVVSGLLEREGLAPIGMFEITAVGAPLLAGGLLLIVLLAPLLLPRRSAGGPSGDTAARRFTVGMSVRSRGPLDGAPVVAGGLDGPPGAELLRIERADGGGKAGRATSQPGVDAAVLRGGDRLTFRGSIEVVVELQRTPGLEPVAGARPDGVTPTRQRYFEAVVGHHSRLAGAMGDEFARHVPGRASVLAIHRDGVALDRPAGDALLQPGDALLLVGDESFARRSRHSSELLVVAELGGEPPRRHKAPVVLAITAALLLAGSTGVLSVLEAALAAAFALVATGVLSLREARDAVDIDVIVIIAGAFGLGEAVAASGLAGQLAALLLAAAAPLGAIGALVAIMIATILLTELVTNNAAAVLVFPIAAAAAEALGVDLRPLAMGVAVAASASFLTPIGYQTNTMVLGPGGYRFGDYARFGLPLTVMVLAIGVTVIPHVWPF